MYNPSIKESLMRLLHPPSADSQRRVPGSLGFTGTVLVLPAPDSEEPGLFQRVVESGLAEVVWRAVSGAEKLSRGAIAFTVKGPTPGTSSRSSGHRKEPCCCRKAMMARARTGPISGSVSSVFWSAALTSIRASAARPSGTAPAGVGAASEEAAADHTRN